MEKFIITIAREYGSGGRGIAHRLAEALNIRYYDKELIRMASEDSGISEALFNLTDEKLEDKFLRKHGIAKGSLVAQPQPDRLTKEELFRFQSEIIKRLADKDESCIIIGRCGQYILKNRPDLVRVFIHANKNYCVEKLMDRYGIDKAEATALWEKTNKNREDYHRHYTGTEWSDVRNYDLSIDTSRLTQDECIRIITEYIKAR